MPNSPWTPEDENKLRPFFTNLDRDVFGLRLPQEVAGALFSRYSRSSKSLRRTFLDEFFDHAGFLLGEIPGSPGLAADQEAALKKARAFYERVLVGYGDDSVAQLGGAHLACENISNVAANILEDARIGIAPLEKSTRYVRFDKKNAEGHYLFCLEPAIMASPYAKSYGEVLNHLFEVYSRELDGVLASVGEFLPIEKVEFKHPQTGEVLDYRDASGKPDLKRWAESAYRSTIRAHSCDVLRGLLPMATQTNVGFFGVGQAFEYLVTKCYSNPLAELRSLGDSMHRELNQLIPSFVKRAKASEYLERVQRCSQVLNPGRKGPPASIGGESVRLVDFDREGESKVLRAVLFPGAEVGYRELDSRVVGLETARRKAVLDEYVGHRRNRREKPGRAFENTSYTFEILCNIGIYRDLHRHRILTQDRQRFTVEHGYDTPPELEEMGLGGVFDECMERAAVLCRSIEKDLPYESQYTVPFAYRVRWYMTLNLRELYHLVELRTMPQGHPDYRLVAQDMMRKVGEVHPLLASYAVFTDWNTYRLGRLQSELRTEYKKTILSEEKPEA